MSMTVMRTIGAMSKSEVHKVLVGRAEKATELVGCDLLADQPGDFDAAGRLYGVALACVKAAVAWDRAYTFGCLTEGSGPFDSSDLDPGTRGEELIYCRDTDQVEAFMRAFGPRT